MKGFWNGSNFLGQDFRNTLIVKEDRLDSGEAGNKCRVPLQERVRL